MNSEAARIEHLKLIQGVVDRLSRNSFAVKSVATAATAALVAFTAGTEAPVAALAGVTVLPLWVLDALFLDRERGFRRLYDSVRRGAPLEHGHSDYFTMGVPSAGHRHSLLRAASSASLSLFYVSLLVLVGVSALVTLV
ncbi:MAG: hypothetical protein F4Z77_02800 [Dehalococcoidia bacterium]|nr:hypothetical protein [Dehalococcoidia bacterium]MYA52114.1 hypothetical protein [Dehalococcoidia bacterium]MYD86850.1 hypothetical protein [Acidobacteriota bacterium]MYH68265.1 hypothetical protein [Dehalococcoidia bacterium]